MTSREVSNSVRRLIVESIDTVSELEAILLLREHRDIEWTADEAARRLYVSLAVSGHILNVLSKRGFLAESGKRYRYSPATPALEAATEELAGCYSRDLIAVTQLIHAKPTPSVLQFADAFRVRKDD